MLNIDLFAQKDFISYEKVKVANIASIEQGFNSKTYQSKLESVESTKDSLIRYGKLKYYNRPKNKNFGEISVTYYYLKDDSHVRKIDYSWKSPKDSKLEDFSNQFDKTAKKIASDLNLSIGEQGKLTKFMDLPVDDIQTEITQRKITWSYRDSEITIIMVWSENHGAYLSTEISWKK